MYFKVKKNDIKKAISTLADIKNFDSKVIVIKCLEENIIEIRDINSIMPIYIKIAGYIIETGIISVNKVDLIQVFKSFKKNKDLEFKTEGNKLIIVYEEESYEVDIVDNLKLSYKDILDNANEIKKNQAILKSEDLFLIAKQMLIYDKKLSMDYSFVKNAYVNINEDSLTVFGTDTHRINESVILLGNNKINNYRAYIKYTNLYCIKKILDKIKCNVLSIDIQNELLILTSENLGIIFKKETMTDDFWDTFKMPLESPGITLDREGISTSIDALTEGLEDKNIPIKLCFNTNGLSFLETENKKICVEEYTQFSSIEITDEVVVNLKYLIDAIALFIDDSINICLDEKGILFKSQTTKHLLFKVQN